ncbi:hypothetical protein D3C87_1923400 [compost metagenome]
MQGGGQARMGYLSLAGRFQRVGGMHVQFFCAGEEPERSNLRAQLRRFWVREDGGVRQRKPLSVHCGGGHDAYLRSIGHRV